METRNSEDEKIRKFVSCFSFSDWNSLLDVGNEYTLTENSDAHSTVSVFRYPQTPISAPATLIPPAQSQFQIYPDPDRPFHFTGQSADFDEEILQWRNDSTQPPLPPRVLYDGYYNCTNQQLYNWDGGERSGIEQNPIVEESEAKRKSVVKPSTKRPSKKRRTLISRQDLELQFGKTRKVAASCLRVSVSTLKRYAREYKITRWPCNRKNKNMGSASLAVDHKTPNSDLNACIAKTEKKKGVERFMIVKVKYKGNLIKFELSNLSKMSDLREQVSKRLELNAESFQIKYMDEDEDWILLPCDVDLEYCMRSLGESTTINMLVLPVTT